jgi:PBP1b-binding outer membrane lipoprotein LpoB
MKKILFIALFGILFFVGCSSQNKTKEATPVEAEQVQKADDGAYEETEGAIDDSGEIVQDSTDEVESE